MKSVLFKKRWVLLLYVCLATFTVYAQSRSITADRPTISSIPFFGGAGYDGNTIAQLFLYSSYCII